MNHEMNAVKKVEAIATKAHEGQCRRDGVTPYIEHPKAVAAIVGGDEKAEMVAWLHDVIEDTAKKDKDKRKVRNSLKKKGVPSDVIEAVDLMTHSKGKSYGKYLEPIKSSPLAKKVKIADMLANLSDSPTKKQIKKYSRGLLFLLDYTSSY